MKKGYSFCPHNDGRWLDKAGGTLCELCIFLNQAESPFRFSMNAFNYAAELFEMYAKLEVVRQRKILKK